MKLIDGIPIWGTPDEGAVSQIKTCAKTADRVALMADHHKGYAVPIGGVVAYKDAISPSGVGFDIACGNKAVLLDIPGSRDTEQHQQDHGRRVQHDQLWNRAHEPGGS